MDLFMKIMVAIALGLLVAIAINTKPTVPTIVEDRELQKRYENMYDENIEIAEQLLECEERLIRAYQ